MARKRYHIKMTFTYNNGDLNGVLETTVNSKRAVEIQLDANRQWLQAKGHTETGSEIVEVTK